MFWQHHVSLPVIWLAKNLKIPDPHTLQVVLEKTLLLSIEAIKNFNKIIKMLKGLMP